MKNSKLKVKSQKFLFLFIFFYFFLYLISLSFAMGLWKESEADKTSIEFVEAMDFTLPDLAGNEVSLKDFKNKVVLLAFWTTWCPSCVKEIAILKDIYNRYNNKNVEIIAVDIGENKERISRFKEKKNIPYRILMDEDRRASNLYRVVGVPTDIIIDREGRVRYYNFRWPYNLEEIIEELLKQDSQMITD